MSIKKEEKIIEQDILNTWSVGLPVYRSHTAYPSTDGVLHGDHSEPSFLIKPQDILLLYNRTPEKLLLNNKTGTLNFLSTRLKAVENDSSPYCNIFLPNLSVYTYYKNY